MFQIIISYLSDGDSVVFNKLYYYIYKNKEGERCRAFDAMRDDVLISIGLTSRPL